MKCSLRGYEFEKNECAEVCAGCPLSKGCNMIRCPNCGYEVPAESRLVKTIRNWRKKRNETKQ